MSLLAFALCFAGWCLLCLGMERHQRELLGRTLAPSPRRWLRRGGWAALALAFACCVGAQGWEFGPVLWVCLLTVSAVAWVLLLPYAPRWALRLAWLWPAVALATLPLGG